MLQDDQTLADEVTLMARGHFHKLASLAVKVQGARELGALAAHSSIGDSMIPTAFVIEKMAAAWAEKRAVGFSASAFGKGVTTGDEGLRRMTPEEVQQHADYVQKATEAPFSSVRPYPGVGIGVEAPDLDPRLASALKGGMAGTLAGTLGGIGVGLGMRSHPAAKFAVPVGGAIGAAGGALAGWRRGAAREAEKTASDLEKLGAAAYSELGEAHMEKLAARVISDSVSWDELTDIEKVAVGWMGKALGAGKKLFTAATKGRTPTLPGAPKVPGQGVGERLREGWSSLSGKGRTPTMPGAPPTAAQRTMGEVSELRRADPAGGARKMTGGSGPGVPKARPGAAPYRDAPAPIPVAPKHTRGTGAQATGKAGPTGQAPDLPAPPPSAAAPTKRKPLLNWKTKLMLGGTAAAAGGTYLGGKTLDTAGKFLTPQPPGTAYQYGGGSPSHFMNPQMGM